MAKKKKQHSFAIPKPLLGEQSMELTSSPQCTALRPTTSPYTSLPVAIRIGPEHRTYYVPQDYLQNLGSEASCCSLGGDIHLPDVDESTGHVLVHYLYTGLYQTPNDIETSLVTEVNLGFKRAILAYTAAKKYGLFGLQQLAEHKIECFGAKMKIFDVVEAINKDFSWCDTPWFHDYLRGKAKTAFEEDHTVFTRDNFFDHISDIALATFMAKCMVELYNNKVSRMLNTEWEPVPGISEECMPNAQGSPIEEAQPEECYIGNETPIPEECAPETQELPIEQAQPEECYAINEPLLPEECAPEAQELPIEQAQPEECYAINEPLLPEECAPEAQELPIEQAQPQEVSTIEETPTKECSPPEPEPAPAEEMKDGGWSNWAIHNKSMKKGSIFTAVHDSPKEEPTVEIPAPEPIAEEKPAKDWSNCVMKSVVNDATSPLPSAVSEPEPEPAKAKNEAGDWGLSPMATVQKAEGTIVGNGRSDLQSELKRPIEAEGEICPVRAKHLLGDEWKNCRQCRAILRQVAIQLARTNHADEDGYVVVDQMLMK